MNEAEAIQELQAIDEIQESPQAAKLALVMAARLTREKAAFFELRDPSDEEIVRRWHYIHGMEANQRALSMHQSECHSVISAAERRREAKHVPF